MEAYIEKAISGMRDNGFEVVELQTAEQAKEYLLSAIQPGESLGVGGSVSVRELGVLPALSEKGVNVLLTDGKSKEEAQRLRQESMLADCYLCSVNAVTTSGQLVLVDGRGNRVGAVCYGPRRLYFVVSHSKVVNGGINTAIGRVKQTAAPRNACRLKMDTACARTGVCAGKDCQEKMCCLTLTVDRVPHDRTITVLIVEEALGY